MKKIAIIILIILSLLCFSFVFAEVTSTPEPELTNTEKADAIRKLLKEIKDSGQDMDIDTQSRLETLAKYYEKNPDGSSSEATEYSNNAANVTSWEALSTQGGEQLNDDEHFVAAEVAYKDGFNGHELGLVIPDVMFTDPVTGEPNTDYLRSIIQAAEIARNQLQFENIIDANSSTEYIMDVLNERMASILHDEGLISVFPSPGVQLTWSDCYTEGNYLVCEKNFPIQAGIIFALT